MLRRSNYMIWDLKDPEGKPVQSLFDICPAEQARPEWAIGVGKYADGCLIRVAPFGTRVGAILHPSQAILAANRNWPGTAHHQLTALGAWK